MGFWGRFSWALNFTNSHENEGGEVRSAKEGAEGDESEVVFGVNWVNYCSLGCRVYGVNWVNYLASLREFSGHCFANAAFFGLLFLS